MTGKRIYLILMWVLLVPFVAACGSGSGPSTSSSSGASTSSASSGITGTATPVTSSTSAAGTSAKSTSTSGQSVSATATGSTNGRTVVVEEANGMRFTPSKITVNVGDTVVWKNASNIAHTSTSDKGRWDSGNMDLGATFSHTFKQAGTFPYYCMYHKAEGMTGIVVVKQAGTVARPSATAPSLGTTPTPKATVAATGRSSGQAHVVQVNLIEFKIEMPHSLPAGPTTFKVKNSGKVIHNLEIKGNGVDKVFPSNLESGQSMTMKLTLKPGTYRVWCPVDSHAEAGMQLQLKVK